MQRRRAARKNCTEDPGSRSAPSWCGDGVKPPGSCQSTSRTDQNLTKQQNVGLCHACCRAKRTDLTWAAHMLLNPCEPTSESDVMKGQQSAALSSPGLRGPRAFLFGSWRTIRGERSKPSQSGSGINIIILTASSNRFRQPAFIIPSEYTQTKHQEK